MVISTLSAMMYCKNNIVCRSDKVLLGSGSFVGLILSSVKKAGGEKKFGRGKKTWMLSECQSQLIRKI